MIVKKITIDEANILKATELHREKRYIVARRMSDKRDSYRIGSKIIRIGDVIEPEMNDQHHIYFCISTFMMMSDMVQLELWKIPEREQYFVAKIK